MLAVMLDYTLKTEFWYRNKYAIVVVLNIPLSVFFIKTVDKNKVLSYINKLTLNFRQHSSMKQHILKIIEKRNIW